MVFLLLILFGVYMDGSGLTVKIGFQVASVIIKNKSPIVDFVSSKAKNFISTDVVVTGTPGVGKSILINKVDSFLKEKYPIKPELSNNVEVNIIRLNDDFLPKKVVVIPGQAGGEQNNAVRDLIINNKKLLGIVHVVDFGCTKPRSDMTEMHYISSGIDTIEKLRVNFIEKEIEYFKELCSFIKRANNKIKWLHIVINKVDLFSQRLKEAVNHYHDNEFGGVINDIKNHLGGDFNVSYSFAISSRDNIVFNNERLNSIVDEKMNEDILLKEFISKLSKYFE